MAVEKNPVRGVGKLLDDLTGYYSQGLTAFVDRQITGVWTNSDGRDVAFTFDDGSTIYADPEGDCCSHSWVEHVSGVAAAEGATIVSVDERPELDSQKNVDDSGYDCLALYGISLITAHGERIDIDYRNESNGYYGGWLNWRHDDDAPDPKTWHMVREDW